MNDEKWFPRFAEIPGINYKPPANLDFTYLPGRGKVPEVNCYNLNGKKHRYIMWKYGERSTSASPARDWETTPRQGESEPLTLLRQVYETLELPGVLSDYHFALQKTHGDLHSLIGREVWIPAEIEKLCLLNIQLLNTHPETISHENEEGIHYASVTVFNRLLKLYKTEGYLQDALKIARIAVKFDYGDEIVEELEARIKSLEDEDEYD